MSNHTFWVFNRQVDICFLISRHLSVSTFEFQGNCICSHEFGRSQPRVEFCANGVQLSPMKVNLQAESGHKLLFGLFYSMRHFVNELDPRQNPMKRFNVHHFRTKTYMLSFSETTSGLFFSLSANPPLLNMREETSGFSGLIDQVTTSLILKPNTCVLSCAVASEPLESRCFLK